MPEIDVSVILAVYNGEKYIRKSVESILNQTYTNFELILINDASSDKTKEIIDTYSDPRIVLIDNTVNMGLTKSLNKGLNIAKGEYIARIDADDISYIKRLEIQRDFLVANKNYVLVGTAADLINDKDEIVGLFSRPNTHDKIVGEIFFNNPIIHSSVMFRKIPVIEVGCYNEYFTKSQDYDLWLHLLKKGHNLVNINKSLIAYRMHNERTSLNQANKQETLACQSIKQNIKDIFNLNVSTGILKEIRVTLVFNKKSSFINKFRVIFFLKNFYISFSNHPISNNENSIVFRNFINQYLKRNFLPFPLKYIKRFIYHNNL